MTLALRRRSFSAFAALRARADRGRHAGRRSGAGYAGAGALVKQHLWRQGSDLRAWMFTIMHNVFVNQVRARPADITVALDAEAYDVPANINLVDRLEVGDMDAAIRCLPDEQREVLLLIALGQLSYGETAQVLGIPLGTVMSRLHRARERLRTVLGGEAVSGAPVVVKVVK